MAQQWSIPGFTFISHIGKGGYGSVNKLAYSKDKTYEIAVKKVALDNDQLSFANRHQLNEVLFCHCLKEVVIGQHKYGLFDLFEESVDEMQNLKKQDFQRIVQLLFSAYHILSKKKLVHNDIKPANILRKANKFKLNDYSRAHKVQNGGQRIFLEQIYQIVFCIYQIWCYWKGKIFIWEDFFQFESRTNPLFDADRDYFYNDIEAIQQQFPLFGRVIKQVLQWEVHTEIMYDIFEIFTQKIQQSTVTKWQQRNTELSLVIDEIYNAALLNLKNLEKARHQNKYALESFACHCGKKYGSLPALLKHKKNKGHN